MKSLLKTLILVFATIYCFGQDRVTMETVEDETVFDSKKLPIISGQLLNYSAELQKDLVLKYTLYVPELKNEVFRKIDLKEDGSFNIELEKALPYQLLWLNISDVYIGKLLVNSDLSIEADLSILEKKPVELIGKGITFSGTDGAITEYINEFGKYAIPKKVKVNKAKFNTLMNRTAQSAYKEKLIRENYVDLEKIERDFARKKGKEFQWFLENQRLTEMHTDFLSIFIGTEVDKKIWTDAMDHQPMGLTGITNQFYDMIAFHVSNPTGNEERKMRRNIYVINPDDKEENEKLNTFLREMDKKNAGISYDNETYIEGLENYIKKNEKAMETARLELLANKLSMISAGKRNMVGFKLVPRDLIKREMYLSHILAHISSIWCSSAINDEFTQDKERIGNITALLKSTTGNKNVSKLGRDGTHLASGAGIFISEATSVNNLLSTIKTYFAGNAIIIGIWNVQSAASTDDMKKSLAMIDRLDGLSVKTVFLCVSDNTDAETWKNTVANIYIGGEHVFLSKTLSIELMEYFELNTYPSYLFVDKDGNYDPDFIDQLSRINIKELEARI